MRYTSTCVAAFFAPKLAQVANVSAKKGRLPAHFLDGDISMLYKKGGRCDPRNYHPITLLNTDYKIFTRTGKPEHEDGGARVCI